MELLFPGVLSLSSSVSSRTQIIPIARVINSQMEAVSWLAGRGEDPSVNLFMTFPSLGVSKRVGFIQGFPVVKGAVDISQRTAVGVSFYPGRWNDDNLLVFSPEVTFSMGDNRRHYLLLGFVHLCGPDDFEYKAQFITLLQVLKMFCCNVIWGIRVEDISCETWVAKPDKFRQTVVTLLIGTSLCSGKYVKYGLESSISGQFVDLKLTLGFKI